MRYGNCLDCENRNIRCHANCENYEIYKRNLEKIKQQKLYEQQSKPTHNRKRR